MAKNQLNLDEIHVATIKKHLREQGKEHTNQAAIDYALEVVAKQVSGQFVDIEDGLLRELWNRELYIIYCKRFNNFVIIDEEMQALSYEFPFEDWKEEFYKINK
jgi:glycerol-3-phosphate O-acyltransferase